ncbi:hypothetical protein GTN42_01865 [bacterium]|nr:hypothetical protein [bacterium]
MIPEIDKIIGEKGVRHKDVHESDVNRYWTWGYFGTTSGKEYEDKLFYLKRTREDCINEMNGIYDKVIAFSENILKKIDKEIEKRKK